jgi:hypothetical protein
VQHDENKFDMNAFTRYIEELQSYETVIYYLKEAVLTVSVVLSSCLTPYDSICSFDAVVHGSTAIRALTCVSFGLAGLALARSLRRQYLWKDSCAAATFHNCICLGCTRDRGFQSLSVVSSFCDWMGVSCLQ